MKHFENNNYFNGHYYLPIKPEVHNNSIPESEICKMVENGLNPKEIGMIMAIEQYRSGNLICFVKVESCTKHWDWNEKLKAMEGLVDKGYLKKCNMQEFRSIVNNKETSETENKTNNTYRTLEISNHIDYMSQFAFGFFIVCYCFQNNCIFYPSDFQRFTKWDDQTIIHGLEMLEKFGYLKLACHYRLDFPDEVETFTYYIFRKSITDEFQELQEVQS